MCNIKYCLGAASGHKAVSPLKIYQRSSKSAFHFGKADSLLRIQLHVLKLFTLSISSPDQIPNVQHKILSWSSLRPKSCESIKILSKVI